MSGNVLNLVLGHPGNSSCRVPWSAPCSTSAFSPGLETPRQTWGLWEDQKRRGPPNLGSCKMTTFFGHQFPFGFLWAGRFYWKVSRMTLRYRYEQKRDLGSPLQVDILREQMGHWKILKIIWKLASFDSQFWKGLEFLRRSKPTCQMSFFLYSGSQMWLLLYWLTVPWELRVSAAPPRFWAGCARSTTGTLVLSLWNVLWMGISDGSSHSSAFSMWLDLLQTGNERENAGEGGLPEDTVTLQWNWLLPVYLLLAAGFPNPSVSGSALLVCLPAPIQHCREDGYPSQEPPSRNLFHHPPEAGAWLPTLSNAQQVLLWHIQGITAMLRSPCAHGAKSRLCEEGVWIFL